MGVALAGKGEVDGAIAETREAVRLNPQSSEQHYFLGRMLELKGDLRGALGEIRAASELDRNNPEYLENYERLLQRINRLPAPVR